MRVKFGLNYFLVFGWIWCQGVCMGFFVGGGSLGWLGKWICFKGFLKG
jgi:hypothetical protein